MSTKQRNFLIKLTMLISDGMLIDGVILGAIGIMIPTITHDLEFSLARQGLIGASALTGIFIGGLLGGCLADKVGRKPMFASDLAIFLIGSVAQFFFTEGRQLFAVRFLMGVAKVPTTPLAGLCLRSSLLYVCAAACGIFSLAAGEPLERRADRLMGLYQAELTTIATRRFSVRPALV